MGATTARGTLAKMALARARIDAKAIIGDRG